MTRINASADTRGASRTFERPHVNGVRVDRDVEIVARDGTVLRADVYRPDSDGHSHPTLLAVSGYQKKTAGLPVVAVFPFRETGPIEWYVQRGYAYVLADARGTGDSDGTWNLQGPQEQTDLYDMVEWAAAQPWSTGKVGMIGQSYYGLVQWHAALQHPPHLACIAPYDALVDHYRDNIFHGGIPCNFAASWDMVLRGNHVWGPTSQRGLRFETSPLNAQLDHPHFDDFWREREVATRLHEVTIPVLSVGNWGKNALHARGNVLGFENVRGPKRLRMEAAAQPPSMNVTKALLDFESVELHETVLGPWYDHWLKGMDNDVLTEPAVSVFVSGENRNRSFDSWPPAEAADRSFYLAAGPDEPKLSLNDGRLQPDSQARGGNPSTSYSYPDPRWHLGTAEVVAAGPPNPVSRVLTFSTGELTQDVTVVGNPRLELYLSSDQLDTDVIVRVCDVAPRPDGLPEAMATPFAIVSKGWLRASHRELDSLVSTETRPYHRHDRPAPLVPGDVYRLDVELMPFAHTFETGHRIRLDLANADSPVTEAVFSHYYTPKVGTDTVHHDAESPSRLVLPIVATA